MTYGRVRNRNGLSWRPDDEQWPYPTRSPYIAPDGPFPARRLCWVCDR